MNPGNLATITTPAGNVYAYACQNGFIQKYYIDFTTVATGQGANSKISFATNGPSNASAVAAVLQITEDGSLVKHIFYQEQKTNRIWYFADSGVDKQSFTALPTQLTVQYPGPSSPVTFMGGFSAVAHADGVILAGIPNTTMVEALIIPWSALSVQTWMQGVGGPIYYNSVLPEGVQFDLKDCDLTATIFTDPTSGIDYFSWMARAKDKSNTTNVFRYCDTIAADWNAGGILTPAAGGTGLCFKQQKVQYPKLLTRPDNVIEFYFFDNNWSVMQMTASVATYLSSDPITAVSQSDFSIVDSMSKGKGSNVQYGNNAFGIVFVNGTLVQGTSQANPALQDMTLPLYPAVVYWSNGNILHQVSQQVWIQLARRGLPAVPGQKILLGIIEGPPPVPNENLNMLPTWDPYTYRGQPGFADTMFASTQSDASGINLSWKAAILFSAQTKLMASDDLLFFEAEAYIKAQLDLQLAYRGTYANVVTSTLTPGTTCRAEMPQDSSGHSYVKAAGSLLLMDAQWTGYAYQILDANGNQVVGAVSYRTIFPTHTAPVSVPYLIPPASGFPVPGDLMSYVLEPDEESALQANSVIQFTGGVNYLTNSWGYNTKTMTNYTTTKQITWTHGLSIDLKVLLGVGGKMALFGTAAETDISGGLQLGFESTWSWVNSSGQNIGTDVQLRGNSQAPNSYTYYVFYLYQLAESNQWTQDLLANFITPSFPQDPNERSQQQALYNAIYPGSTPWKICYSVDPQNFHFNQPSANVLARASTVAPELAESMAKAGVETSQNVVDLLGAAEHVKNSGSPDDALAMVSHAASGDAGELKNLIGTLASSPDISNALAAAVSSLQHDIRAQKSELQVKEVAAAPVVSDGLAVGGRAYVASEGGLPLRLRSGPGLNQGIVDRLAPRTQMTLLEGPQQVDNHAWWHIRTSDGREGWVAGEELRTQPD